MKYLVSKLVILIQVFISFLEDGNVQEQAGCHEQRGTGKWGHLTKARNFISKYLSFKTMLKKLLIESLINSFIYSENTESNNNAT